MIKMFGVGGEQDARPGGCNLEGGRSGASLKESKRKKNLLSCLFRHLYVWSSGPQPPFPLHLHAHSTSEGICPLIPL